MVERPQLKASDRSMTAHSASPRATPPFPFPREKLKKGYASFRAAGPPWNSGLVPWMSFRALPPLPFPREELKKDLPSIARQTSPSQIAHFSLDSIARKWHFLLDPKWLTDRMQKPAMVR